MWRLHTHTIMSLLRTLCEENWQAFGGTKTCGSRKTQDYSSSLRLHEYNRRFLVDGNLGRQEENEDLSTILATSSTRTGVKLRHLQVRLTNS